MTVNQLAHTGTWTDYAACRDVNPEVFFPIGNGSPEAAEALKICAVCPVRHDCLTAALKRADVGIWGGTTEAQRRRMRAGQQPHVIPHPPEKPVTIQPTPSARPAGEPVAITNLEVLIRRGEASESAATRAAAKKAREAVEQLRQRVRDEEAEQQVRAEVAELEAKLAAAKKKLRTVKPSASRPRPLGLPNGVTPKQIRDWANDSGVACPAKGRVPKNVIDLYATAHGLAKAS